MGLYIFIHVTFQFKRGLPKVHFSLSCLNVFFFFWLVLKWFLSFGLFIFFLFCVGGAQVAPLVWASKHLETG
jgi:hypothetical protein